MMVGWQAKGGRVRVAELWRYPVKSMQGERLVSADLEPDGIAGDRTWALQDMVTGKVLTGRREPRLLQATARLDPAGGPVVALPDGTRVEGSGAAADDALSDWLGRRVRMVAAAGVRDAVAECFEDATDDSSAVLEWTLPVGRFVDLMPLLLLTTASLRTGQRLHPAGAWHVRRFRPNVLVEAEGDGWLEDAWCGELVLLGAATLAPQQGCTRCTMVTRPQGELPDDRDIFRTLARQHRAQFGVWSTVLAPARINIGDAVAVMPAPTPSPASESLAAEPAS